MTLRIRIRRTLLILASLACVATAAPARTRDDAGYAVAPAASWVLRIDDPAPAPAGRHAVPGGARWWLADEQLLMDGPSDQEYHRTVVEAVNDRGLEIASRHEIEFDPSCERVTLHDIRVVRDGVSTSRLKAARIQLLQRETDLDSQIYDGRRTLAIALPDIRRGDVVDWSWTIAGRNPVFGRHRFGDADMQWSAPVLHLHRRLLLPADAPLRTGALGDGPAAKRFVAPPVTRAAGAHREITWDQRDVPALHVDPDMPPGYEPYAGIEWSDFASWGDVARWAMPLYAVPARLGPALAAERDRIVAASKDPAARVMAVLQLVQRDVRYLGVEIGANTHAPRPPDTVFDRRYGDCKEKALLMATLLRAMDIDAVPALVHTRRRLRLAGRLPSPDAFDHVIVRVRTALGTSWLDPTRAPQGGDLAHVYQPDYGYALPLEASATDLVRLPDASALRRRREVTAVLDASAGEGHAATLDVTTVYIGAAADDERGVLGDEDAGEIQRRFTEFYTKRWPSLRVSAPFEVRDSDPARNELTVVEHYAIERFWRHGDRGPLTVAGSEIEELLDRPDHPVRRSPLELGARESMSLRLVVRLPRHWEGLKDDANDTVVDPAFRFARRASVHGSTLTLAFDYARTATEVATDAAGAYDEHVADARDLLDETVEAPARSTWPFFPVH